MIWIKTVPFVGVTRCAFLSAKTLNFFNYLSLYWVDENFQQQFDLWCRRFFILFFLVLAYAGIADHSSEYWISVPSLDCLERRSAERWSRLEAGIHYQKNKNFLPGYLCGMLNIWHPWYLKGIHCSPKVTCKCRTSLSENV